MKTYDKHTSSALRYKGPALLALLLLPAVSFAQKPTAIIIPVQMSLMAYLIIGFLLVLSILMFFLFQRRYNNTAKELDDVIGELSITRNRLTESKQRLDTEKREHTKTTQRYSNILFDAEVGMFQMDLAGKCTYINDAFQEISGLYAKKAMKEGIESAIHPDDKKAFINAWDEFTEKKGATFEHSFRFIAAKGREVHAFCKANKILDGHKDVESYIGWVTEVTRFHDEVLLHQAETARFEHFVSETIEGFYKLVPETPISLDSKPEMISSEIMNQMELADCNDTFAAMYGSKSGEVLGKSIGELKDGCGPFNSTESIQAFIKAGYQSIDLESIRQNSSGNRIHLMNNVIGMVEDNKLVSIWGMQRNISQSKREKAELTSEVNFLQRILNSLPADVHVKDTRCRYLYASKKLADRTGIAQEEWLGKTIHEVMPATPREHDQLAIEAMKAGTLKRGERKYEAKDKKGWMENLQIPLISDNGLVEGVVSLSIEISDRKKKEEAALSKQVELETRLVNTQNALADSKKETSQTAVSLSTAVQKLKMVESAKINNEHEFRNTLAEQKRTEENLRRNEQGLLARQQQLEEQLGRRLAELELETNKRIKWEELLAIKEDELRKLEENLAQLTEHYAQETTRREYAESTLEHAQASLDKARGKVAELMENRERELEKLNSEHSRELESEQIKRKKAEKHLTRTKEFLESTQEQVKRMTDQHADELEKEVAERKTSAEKLIKSMEELDGLRNNFNQRIESETKSIKRELAKKQIHEKALRRHEKDLENRIKELENTLHLKSKEYAEQIQAREGAEVEKHQIEEKMEQLTKHQQQLLARETQKLNLNIAEIRLDEVKLRKRAGDLERENEQLEEKLRVRENFMEKARQEQAKTEAELKAAQARLKQLTGDQSKLISEETAELQRKLKAMQKTGEELKLRMNDLGDEKKQVEQNLDTRTEELSKAAREYRKVVDAYKATQQKLKELTEGQEELIARNTGELKAELKKFQRSEQMLKHKESELTDRINNQQGEIGKLNATLKDETDRRYEAEKTLRELEVTLKASLEDTDSRVLQQTQELTTKVEQYRLNEASLTAELKMAEASVKMRDEALSELKAEREETQTRLKELETQLSNLRKEHQVEMKKSLAEAQKVSSMNDRLVDELNETIQDSLTPVVKTTLLLEKSGNLSEEQKRQLASANYGCRNLIDTMNYRAELTQLNAGNDGLAESEFDLHSLITGIDEQFSHRATTNKLFFAVSFAQYQAANNVPKRVIGDEEKLKKSLTILLGYALSKTKKGRLGLHATRKSADNETMNISFELAYTPVDKKDELLDGIFNSESEAVVDLKHGLTLARRYIKMLGGKTEMEYRDAGVTSLTINMPLKRTGSEIIMPGDDDEKQAGAA
ncbi:PAS domain S-box protein [Pontiellaceae bacterium B1224]|nr:PAS domain S-box protein [Pontiellaceae bacterium B1224]